MDTALLERAERWLAHDPDPETRGELRALLDAARANDEAAIAELRERFAGPLEFGTAGLRGLLGAGETRMNRAVVLRTTAGLAKYLLSDAGSRVKERGVVVGHDARRGSRVFAEDTARVLAAHGIPAHLSPDIAPTPLTAYAVKHLDAAAGVMVTASHNPPLYNGYKVYWGNGAQIIPPQDKGIAAAIDAEPAADQIAAPNLDAARAAGLVRTWPEALERSYVDAVLALSLDGGGDRSAAIVYTPLHGVGGRLALEILARAGFTRALPVAEQLAPDGAFPTVAFPNPEEKGAMDLSFALAEREGADLVLANDPDADRLAAAVRGADGKLVQLSGNEVGVLLGHYLLTSRTAGKNKPLVIASCVSSPMLGAIAERLGARYAETLTGFKWIANTAMALEAEEPLDFVFGYEEALGYAVGTLVRDKDGLSAALLFAELFARRRAEGKTLLDELDEIARRFGLFVSGQRAITLPGSEGLARIAEAMRRLRAAPPKQVGPLAVVATSDYVARIRTLASGETAAIPLPTTNMVVLELEGGSRLIARPSGTEPKLKIYFDVREEVRAGEPIAEARARAEGIIAQLAAALLPPLGL
jgi:phosphomannomutase